MADHIACPHCRRVVQVPEEFHGKQVRCPECQGVFTAAATDITATPQARRASGRAGWEGEFDLRRTDAAGSGEKRWYEAGDAGPARFQSASGLAMATKIMLGLNLLTSLVILGSLFMQHQLATRLVAGEPVRPAELQDDQVRSVILTVLHLIVYLATGIVFLAWFHRAYVNLPALGARGLICTSGWAIGAWFVPILNLFRPVQIAQEIWRNSDPDAATTDDLRIHVPESSALISFWWMLWIVNLVLSQVALRMSSNANTAESFQSATIVSMVSEAVRMVTAVFALRVVSAIDARQTARAAALAAMADDGG
jgi:hypothetical protein